MYTASSVKRALTARKKLRLIGLDTLGCPNDGTNLTDGNRCCGMPAKCYDMSARYSCKQVVYVYIKGIASLYTILYFYFPISGTNADGFIKDDNSELGRLIDNDFIDRNILETV